MEGVIPESLFEIVEMLEKLDNKSILNGVSHQFLELELSGDKRELRINGNQAGLIHFAKIVIDVAASEVAGSHFHVDDVGVADKCDLPVVICLKEPTWKK